MSVKYIVVGASASGIAAVKEIIAADPSSDVVLISEEEFYPYRRPMLSELIAEESVEEKSSFYLNKPEWYQSENLKFLRGLKVLIMDRVKKTVSLSNNEKYPYDRLILATGSRPFIPIDDAPDGKKIISLRTLVDARNIAIAAASSRNAAVIGGGLLGLEAAYSLKKLGLNVSIIELSSRIMPMQLDDGGSSYIYDLIAESGVTVDLCECVESAEDRGDSISLRLKSGRTMDVNLLILSAGVRPNLELAESCGLAVNKGVIVDKFMTTSDPDIFACGDIAEFEGRLIPLWMPAMRKGKTAGSNAAGKSLEYADEDYPFALNAFGTKIFSVGETSPSDKTASDMITKKSDAGYSNILFKGGIISGFVLIGDTSNSQRLLKAFKAGHGVDELRAGGLI